jgi:hypothetical protein
VLKPTDARKEPCDLQPPRRVRFQLRKLLHPLFKRQPRDPCPFRGASG